VSGHAGGVGEVAGTDQKHGGAPGAVAVGPVAGGAEAQIETGDARGPRRGFGGVEQPGKAAGEETQPEEDSEQRESGPAHRRSA